MNCLALDQGLVYSKYSIMRKRDECFYSGFVGVWVGGYTGGSEVGGQVVKGIGG